mgnify:CR=1 FL=1
MAKQRNGLRVPRSQRVECAITKNVEAKMEDAASRILQIKFDRLTIKFTKFVVILTLIGRSSS